MNKTQMMLQEIAGQCMRARRAENNLAQLHGMLDTLDVSLWQTDRDLRLVGVYGLCVAEGYIDRHIDEFYRDAFGLQPPDAAPMIAHRDAQAGHSATVGWQHAGRRYAMLVEPKRDESGAIIGTVGMSLKIAD